MEKQVGPDILRLKERIENPEWGGRIKHCFSCRLQLAAPQKVFSIMFPNENSSTLNFSYFMQIYNDYCQTSQLADR